MTAYVLVPSPLVGPATWRWVADALGRAGDRVAVADHLGAGGPVVVVGHSGAGPRLPQILVDRDAATTRVVLVDAPMPTLTGATPAAPPELLAHLRTLVDADGLLPTWSEWFGPGVMAELVPDPDRRAAVEAELPRLPLTYFEASMPIPPNWATFDGGYVLLSEVYRPDAEAAAARGWTVLERLGGHLDLVTRPEVVAEALRSLAV